MDMRLKQCELVAEQPCGVCRAQVQVEGDVTLPGSLRETTNVLHAGAMAVVEKTEPMQDRVSVSGRVVFCVLYTQGSGERVESIEATGEFTHICDLPGTTPQSEVFAAAQAEQADATVLGGRMTMRATVRLCVRTVRSEAAEVLAGLEGEHLQQRTARLSLLRTVGRGSGEVLLREEFDLPADLHIEDTLGAQATAVFFDTAGGQGRVGLSGEVTIEAVHASALPGKPLVTTRHTLPVSQSVEMRGEDGERLDGRITVKDVAVASQDVGDGERTLRAEVLLGLEAWSERAEEAEVLTDAYTTSGDALRLEGRELRLHTGDRREHGAESLKTTLLLPEGSKPVRTLLAVFATPVLSAQAMQGNRLMAEGTLHVTLVYVSDDGAVPVSARVDAPFRMGFAMQAAPEDIVLLTAANVEGVPVTSDRVEVRCVLHAQAEGIATQEATAVTQVTQIPVQETTGDIVLYFTQPGEDSWDIAKRYRISADTLHALNPALTDEPKPGQGVVVWHRDGA